MKNLLTAYAVWILCAFSLSADDLTDKIAELKADEEVAMAEREVRFRIRTDAIQAETTNEWIYLPSAGSVQGGFGTYYRSDVTIANYRSVTQLVRARWIPAGGSGLTTEEKTFTIPSRGYITYEDFVKEYMGFEGLGSLEFTARTSGGEIDRNAEIDIYSRIWTRQPNTNLGTVSQNFDGVSFDHTVNAGRLQAIGLKQNLSYRTNYGILNLDPESAQTFIVRVEEQRGETVEIPVTVPAYSMLHQSVPTDIRGDLRITFLAPEGHSSRWAAYATTSDNGTGDGWVAVASKVRP
jgi:hypothetical protein